MRSNVVCVAKESPNLCPDYLFTPLEQALLPHPAEGLGGMEVARLRLARSASVNGFESFGQHAARHQRSRASKRRRYSKAGI
jgi:hypothetical protein